MPQPLSLIGDIARAQDDLCYIPRRVFIPNYHFGNKSALVRATARHGIT